MLIIDNLLRNEYFPAELPPCFTTSDFADNYGILSQIKLPKHIHESSIPLIFSGYKGENARRNFGIPNPYHYLAAIQNIADHSTEIMEIFKKSEFSLSCPTKKKPSKNEAYSRRSKHISDTIHEIEKLYQNNMYGIKLDISSFFDSIYTHSIPWAIHGKIAAKKNHSDSLYGNLLDKCMRNMNYGQTNGILVGNAASRIVSELILCKTDVKIKNRFPNISCKRYVDDYYIFTSDYTQVKSIISFIRTELSEYELLLNENKIEISESPFIYGKSWVEEIEQFIYLDPDIFLSKLIITYNKYKDISILKYGLKVIDLHNYDKSNWAEMQSKLLNLWVRFPSLSNLFLPIFLQNRPLLKINYIKSALYDTINNSITLLHHQETIWAVWCLKVFSITISQEYIKKICESKNYLAIIILLDILQDNKYNMQSKQLINIKSQLLNDIEIEDKDENGNSGNALWSKIWLLTYQAELNDWLNTDKIKLEYAKNDLFFRELLARNIKFYDTNYIYKLDQVSTNVDTYITRKEFADCIKEMKKAIEIQSQKIAQGDKKAKIDLSTIAFFDKLNKIAFNGYDN